MNIEFVGRHVDLTDELRAFTAKKLGKVSKFLEEPVDIRFILEEEKHRQIAELHIAHRFGVLQAKEEAESLQEAINLVVEKTEKQARRSKRKHLDRRRRPENHAWPMEVLDNESLRGENPQPRIVESTRIHIKPMSIDEAALQLESSNDGFIVFRDPASDKVSVLYKRRDQNYGLITPEP